MPQSGLRPVTGRMSAALAPERLRRLGTWWRIACTVAAVVVVQTIVCGLAMLPVILGWLWLSEWAAPHAAIRAAVFALLVVPSYVVFALSLMACSAAATGLTRVRTRPNAEMRIADMDWELVRWVQYMVATHVVRVLAGSLFRSSPVWTAYLRLNGARMGRRVYVNTLAISDHNLLEFGDDVVIGDGVHISGHTVERGVVKTAPVRLGAHVTIGLGSVIDIGVDAGARCQVAPLSVVPKHTTLEGGAVYAGIPVRRREDRRPETDAVAG